ncbi:hypothetical protein OPU71_17400 [Niveibacterium sp. 24ML]|uniref:hypothetical protein n=1 Tax=Niveibacterium sp. 24ML TaxID=2985512 RepID=UPI00226D8DC9|nr:hypothetical protein [Niveibacterium sp. 24ML]MCX9157903.1 hypothetical protein [Niveibacterium sp. 24ML]
MVLPVIAVPWILGGLSAAAGALGLKKGYDAKTNFDHAKLVVTSAQRDFAIASERLQKTKVNVSRSLETLGKLRLDIDSEDMQRFIAVVEQINHANHKPISLGATHVAVSAPELKEIKVSSYQATDLLKDGIGAVSSGVFIGVGASGLASSVGVVAGSTTAISGLTGVAATNATLAWLGGGSLAAGGMGMAGGTAILGGVIAGPALAIIGYSAASKSEKALTEAFEMESEIREAIEQVENGNALLVSIRERSEEMRAVISDLRARYLSVLSNAEKMVSIKLAQKGEAEAAWNQAGMITKALRKVKGAKFQDPLDFTSFSQSEKDLYSLLNLFGVALYRMIKVKILDEDGLVTTESEGSVAEARLLLKGSNSQ